MTCRTGAVVPVSRCPPERRRARRWGDDRGSGTVLLVGVVAVALLLATTLAGLGQVVAARARAQSAADLAALAAATRLQATADIAASCDLADQAATRNGASLTGCAHEGVGVVRVAVGVRTPFGTTTASARAGPSSARTVPVR